MRTLVVAIDGTRIGHHGGRLPTGRQLLGRPIGVAAAILHLHHADGTGATATQHHPPLADTPRVGIAAHIGNSRRTVLCANIDGVPENALHIGQPDGVALHIAQMQPVVDGHCRIAALGQRLAVLAAAFVVAGTAEKTSAKHKNHTG